jgi:hypothetical protein
MDDDVRNTIGTLVLLTVVYVFIRIAEYRSNKRRNRYVAYKGRK